MHNEKTIKYVNENYGKIIVKFSRRFENKQAAEDCLQHILFKLCRKEYGISRPISFINKAMPMTFLNYKRSNKRYFFSDEFLSDWDDGEKALSSLGLLPVFNPTVIDDIDNSQILEIIYNEIDKLPAQQRDAILRRMREEHENTNTEKSNFRHGMMKLKKSLTSIENVDMMSLYN